MLIASANLFWHWQSAKGQGDYVKIIRDEEYGGIMMVPLFIDWEVRRCNVEHCTQQPITIVAGMAENVIGMCEEHYQEANQPGGTKFTFVWDDFNAFDGGAT